MSRTIVCIGGGSIKEKTTLRVDEYIASLAKNKAGTERANALFFPTASFDSLPYFNSFRKIYTSHFGLKCDVALLTKKDIPLSKIEEKILNAHLIYLGGGNTSHMLEVFKRTGVDKLLIKAYNEGKIMAGLSAGANIWFENFYSDCLIMSKESDEYVVKNGLGILKGIVTPHYNLRKEGFEGLISQENYKAIYRIEDNCALIFENEVFIGRV